MYEQIFNSLIELAKDRPWLGELNASILQSKARRMEIDGWKVVDGTLVDRDGLTYDEHERNLRGGLGMDDLTGVGD